MHQRAFSFLCRSWQPRRTVRFTRHALSIFAPRSIRERSVEPDPFGRGRFHSLVRRGSLSDLALPETRSLRITIEFDCAIEIERSRAYFLNQGNGGWRGRNPQSIWTACGIVQASCKPALFTSGDWSEITFPPIKVRCVRLTVQQAGGHYPACGRMDTRRSGGAHRLKLAPCPIGLCRGPVCEWMPGLWMTGADSTVDRVRIASGGW